MQADPCPRHQASLCSPLIGNSAYVDFIRKWDWASTSLGDISQWPMELIMTANLMLADPYPGTIFYGEDLITIYNAAVLPFLSTAHPLFLGRPAALNHEGNWQYFKTSLDSVLQSGQSLTQPSKHMCLLRDGFLGEVVISYTFLPIFDQKQRVVGVYERLFDVTHDHLLQRRDATLLALNASGATSNALGPLWTSVVEGFRVNAFDVPQLLLYSFTAYKTAGTCVLEASLGFDESALPLFVGIDLNHTSGIAPLLFQSKARKAPTIFDRAEISLPDEFWGAFQQRGFKADCTKIAVIPVRPLEDKIVAFLLIGLNPRIHFDAAYKQFLENVQRQVSTSAASTLLLEEEIRRGKAEAEEAAYQLDLRTKEAKDHERRFARFAENAPVGIATYRRDGTVIWANDFWFNMLRLQKDDLLEGRNWWDKVVLASDVQDVHKHFSHLVMHREAVNFELRLKRLAVPEKNLPDELFYTLCSMHPDISSSDGTDNIVAYFTDITEQKKRLEDAIASKRQIEGFIDMTSHELRNPLGPIAQCSQEIIETIESCGRLLRNSSSNREGLNEGFRTVIDAAQTIEYCTSHARDLVNEILELSKLQAGLLPITPEEAQPLKLLEAVQKIFMHEIRAADIELETIIDESFHAQDLEWARLDPRKTSQLVLNIVGNAIKFTKTQARRTITLRLGASSATPGRSDTFPINFLPPSPAENTENTDLDWDKADAVYILFSVEDSGDGMTTEQQRNLFHRFSQGSPRTHVVYGGSGLGLFICKALVELHGGQIGFVSEPGKGSTFGFFIEVGRCPRPVHANGQVTPEPMPLVSAVSPSSLGVLEMKLSSVTVTGADKAHGVLQTPKYNILVVEDNLVNSRVLKRQLQRLGHAVTVANHGQEALDTLLSTSTMPDCICLDIEMPVMDGITCTKRVRDLQRQGFISRHLPIIAITGNARDEKVKSCLDAGMDEVLLKPFTIRPLLKIVDRLVALHQTTPDADLATNGTATPTADVHMRDASPGLHAHTMS